MIADCCHMSASRSHWYLTHESRMSQRIDRKAQAAVVRPQITRTHNFSCVSTRGRVHLKCNLRATSPANANDPCRGIRVPCKLQVLTVVQSTIKHQVNGKRAMSLLYTVTRELWLLWETSKRLPATGSLKTTTWKMLSLFSFILRNYGVRIEMTFSN